MRKTTLALLAMSTLVLAACGGQGTWTGQDDDDDDGSSGGDATLQGAVIKGTVDLAEVCAYTINDGEKDRSLGCTTTDAGGNYLLQVPGSGEPVLVEVVSTGRYTDEATGETRTLDATLRAATTVLPRAAHTLHITPLTELAMRRAAGATRGWTEPTINDAMALVARAYDTADLRTVRPLDPTSRASNDANARGALNHGLGLAGLSQWRLALADSAGSASVVTVETVLAEAELAFKPDLVTAQVATFQAALDNFLRGSGNASGVNTVTIRTQMKLQWEALSGASGSLPAVPSSGTGPSARVPDPVDGPACLVKVEPRSGSSLKQDYRFCLRTVAQDSCNAAGMAANLSLVPNFGLVSSLALVTVDYDTVDTCSGQDANEIVDLP
jgi:hypothetical protein